ncbi:class I SAM-dependent methyltransferase [Bifidobacterium simiarum]|uniref:class I SAM-dependent methyltransferase n=1 Tax=Bifidobacterium simiarum TaxID=2045441 RepID=UPI001BDD7978|nr:class I SAM-dependent methyltransferase [Bifidobacterium simiarum]MBT1165989.1 class I SAM-dependent methyltransferase [Bifidobacterium simiarum]
MANGKSMTISEMVGMFVSPQAPLRVDAFDGSTFGPESAPLHVKVNNPNAVYQIVEHPNEIGVVRAYILGDFDVEGIDYADPYPVLRSFIDMAPYVRKPTPLDVARVAAAVFSHGFRKAPVPEVEGPSKWQRIKSGLLPHTEKADSETVSYHYDQSNDFYADFLGPSMTYTCAVFENESMSLEDAQANKLRLILDKLGLKPGQRLLDIGCGWGSMVITAARRGIKALGVTLSKEQAAYAQEWIRREGLEDLAEVRVMDYRDVPERDFDGICSIGMMEHVGVKNYKSYFEEMFKLLKPMGRLLNHQITISHGKPNGKPGTDEFLDRYIFPDGDLGTPGFIESCIHDSGFNVVHQENLRQHYALTLHHWNHNLSEHWDDAVKQVGFDRAKVWGLYMAACALNFELDGIQIHQFLAVKPDRVGHPDGKWYPLRPWWKA